MLPSVFRIERPPSSSEDNLIPQLVPSLLAGGSALVFGWGSKTALLIKLKALLQKKGFHVYRQQSHSTLWEALTSAALILIENIIEKDLKGDSFDFVRTFH